jgi:anti-sigma factor RsiW
MLNAWIDHELPDHLADQVTRHIEQCQSCQYEASALRRLSKALNAMPSIVAPARLTRNTLKAFRDSFHHPGFLEWWQSLSFSMRSAACSMAIAGLLFGIFLVISLPSYQTSFVESTYISAIYL